jgi:hypothetical protein
LTAVERPLGVGEVLAETVRLYGDRVWAAFGLGGIVALSFVLAAVVRNDVAGTAIIAVAFTAAYAAAARLVRGDGFGEAWSHAGASAPVLAVLGFVVCVPLALGIFDPVLLLFSAFWVAFAGFAVPVAMLERAEAGEGWLGRLAHSMSRSLVLARTHYIHATGVVAALLVIYSFVGRLLAAALVGFGESGAFGAFLLVQIVLAPFLFLGLVVLYFEQRARAVSSPGRT